MKLSASNRSNFAASIDSTYAPETSVVLRYRNILNLGMTDEEDSKYKALLQSTSIKEGARIFHLINFSFGLI